MTKTTKTEKQTDRLWCIEYRPILSTKSGNLYSGNFYEADYTNTTIIEAESARQARKFFHEGNHGVVVQVY